MGSAWAMSALFAHRPFEQRSAPQCPLPFLVRACRRNSMPPRGCSESGALSDSLPPCLALARYKYRPAFALGDPRPSASSSSFETPRPRHFTWLPYLRGDAAHHREETVVQNPPSPVTSFCCLLHDELAQWPNDTLGHTVTGYHVHLKYPVFCLCSVEQREGSKSASAQASIVL